MRCPDLYKTINAGFIMDKSEPIGRPNQLGHVCNFLIFENAVLDPSHFFLSGKNCTCCCCCTGLIYVIFSSNTMLSRLMLSRKFHSHTISRPQKAGNVEDSSHPQCRPAERPSSAIALRSLYIGETAVVVDRTGHAEFQGRIQEFISLQYRRG